MYLFCDIRDYSWSRYLNNVSDDIGREQFHIHDFSLPISYRGDCMK